MLIRKTSFIFFCLSACLLIFQAQVAAESLKIGVLAGFNSILSAEAQQISNGVKLAVRNLSQDDSKRFKLQVIERDTQLNPKIAIQALQDLRRNQAVRYIIGPHSTDEVSQAAVFAEKSDSILITPSARSDDISLINNSVFRTRHSQSQESSFFAPYILSRIKRSPLNVLILDSFAGYAFVKNFKPEYSRIGGNFGLFEDLLLNRPNYAQIIQRLKMNAASNVYIVSLGVQVADLMLEAQDAGLKLDFFGTSENNESLIIERAGNLAEGFTFPYAFDPEKNSASAEFAADYQASFGSAASQTAANAYDAVMILSTCLERVGDSVNAIKSCLFYIRNYQGAGGPLSIDRNGNCRRELFLKTVKDGKFVRLS